MKKNITISGTKQNIDSAIAVLKAMGIEVEVGVGTTTEETKVIKAKTSKSEPKKTKSEDEFPRAEYEALAKELGCLGKHGVWNPCRKTIYAVIGWDSVNKCPCKPTLTKAKAKKAVEAVAKEKGWKLNK